MALNHLLEAEPWARERLAPFAGRVLEVRAEPLPPLRFTVLPDGRVAAGGENPALTVNVPPAALLDLARGEAHFLRSLEVSGEPALAAEVMTLARHLRWDAEEDLSKLFGDVVAHRLAVAGRAFARWHAEALRRLADAFADYAVEEKRLLIARAELEHFAAEVVELRDGVERLEKRVRRLG